MTVALLDELAAAIAATKRRRAPVEAPKELTGAYLDYLFAIAYARVGDSGVARDHATRAAAALRTDDVHGCLRAIFERRLADALAGRSRLARYPEELVARLDGLNRVARYKVDRMREAVRTLEPEPAAISAIGAFSRAKIPLLRAQSVAGDDPAIASQLDDFVEAARASAKNPDIAAIAELLDALIDLPEALAMPIVVRAIPLLERAQDASLARRALELAGRHRWGELVPQLLALLRANLAGQGPLRDEVAASGLAIACRLGLADEVTTTLAALAGDDHYAFVVGGTRAWLGVDSARDAFDAARAKRARGMTMWASIELARQIAVGSTLMPPEPAADLRAQLLAWLEDVTDSFVTNSHFCLLVVQFVDVLVGSIVDRYDAVHSPVTNTL